MRMENLCVSVISSMDKLRIINFINQESLEHLRHYLEENHYHILELNGDTIKDKKSFFVEAIKKLPQDPPLHSPPIGQGNWDAFIDSSIGGLANLETEKVALIWTSVENMLESGLPDLIEAINCFRDACHEVTNALYGFPRKMTLLTFLVGKGNNFKLIGE